ncbi:LacI family DNA-binding transcriptional regulator [Effusibacillus pohliae]|uniref:LacI family DNA-binding transcriptional regulator n=1 Tax=Effusibacillus pohliae TaxID=232270 RepID=UPI00035C57A5|nr:LacI family DNA-binding transcriptional regulator [Effusibacillus pohliae]
MATIKDVAKLAGVAVSTASYALNNSGLVSSDTRKKVLDAARRLNYQPSGIARDLKSNKTNTVGLILPDLSGPFYSELIKGIQDVTIANGYDLIAVSSIGGKNSTAAKFLKEKRADGVIILASNIDENLISDAARKDMPVVLLDKRIEAEYVLNIQVDNEGGAYKAVEHLVSLGRNEIAYLSGPSNSFDNSKRFEGYKKALRDHGIPFSGHLLYQGNFTKEGGNHAAKLMLLQNRLPEAIFAANDEMAIGAMEVLKQAGINIGQEIAIVGFDDIQLAEYVQPPLTTIRQPMREMGSLAAQQIFRALNGDFSSNFILLETELIIRESCGGKQLNKQMPR